jgi:hypothetical protein
MLYRLGRLLQVVALLLLPVAMAGQLAGRFGEGKMLAVAGLGVVVFLVGWLLQQAGRSR